MAFGGRILAILLAIAASLAMLSPAQARALDSRCAAALPAAGDLVKWLDSGPGWTCPGSFDELAPQGHAVRFALEGGEMPAFVVSRIAAFESMTIAAQVEGRGWQQLAHYRFDQIRPTYLDRQLAVPLGQLPVGTRAIVVAIHAPTQAIPLDFLRLEAQAPGSTPVDLGRLLVIALVCGVILTPLVFDFIFYRVLRQAFILWHAVFVLCIAAQLSLTAGLYLPFIDINIRVLRVLTVSSFGAMACVAIMFIISFVERDAISQRLRRILIAGVLGYIPLIAFHAPGFTRFGSIPASLFYCGGLPLAIALVCGVVQAWRRGSVFVRYVVVGLSPLFLVTMARVAGYILPGIPTEDFNDFFLFGVMIEAIATAMGVAARFVQIKRERDEARSEARTLAGLAGEDPLTGLMNRRSVESRFAQLHRAGYETIALLDLDYFKQINDTFGHAKGDAVLCAVADALVATDDVLAVRVGGEEFMLLVGGADSAAQAERIRQSITARVAGAVPGLDRPVTASMGVVTAPFSALPMARFADLYAMADKLLYEAKRHGRNRMVAERLHGFNRSGRDRRRPAAA